LIAAGVADGYTSCYALGNSSSYTRRHIVATTADKTRETRLRRMAERQGLALVKSRRRDPLAKDYGLYWVIDPDADRRPDDPDWPFPGRPAHRFPSKGADIDKVEEFLTTPPKDR
jgi:hypothetical protein